MHKSFLLRGHGIPVMNSFLLLNLLCCWLGVYADDQAESKCRGYEREFGSEALIKATERGEHNIAECLVSRSLDNLNHKDSIGKLCHIESCSAPV